MASTHTHTKSISIDHSLESRSPHPHTHIHILLFLHYLLQSFKKKKSLKEQNEKSMFHNSERTRWVLQHFCSSLWERECIYHSAAGSILAEPTWCTFPGWLRPVYTYTQQRAHIKMGTIAWTSLVSKPEKCLCWLFPLSPTFSFCLFIVSYPATGTI